MKKTISFALTVIISLSLFGCANSKQNEKFSETHLGSFDTVTTVAAYDYNKKSFDENFELFKRELERYDKLFSIYNKYDGITNLAEINEKAKVQPVKADSEIIELLLLGKEYYKKTNGTVNICMGSVLKLWHEARETSTENPERAYIPDNEALAAAAKHTDINSLIIDKENSTVFFKDKEMSLDVGAVAKGFAAQKIADKIKSEGVWKDFVISIGGNVVTSGYKDGNSKWNVEIENPNKKSKSYFEVLSITDKSVVTSGDYQRFFTVNGKNYCHIINPETLFPAEDFTSVTVISEDSALGDALSTALFILPIDEGKKLIESIDGAEAMWADKNYKKTYSSGFESYVRK